MAIDEFGREIPGGPSSLTYNNNNNNNNNNSNNNGRLVKEDPDDHHDHHHRGNVDNIGGGGHYHHSSSSSSSRRKRGRSDSMEDDHSHNNNHNNNRHRGNSISNSSINSSNKNNGNNRIKVEEEHSNNNNEGSHVTEEENDHGSHHTTKKSSKSLSAATSSSVRYSSSNNNRRRRRKKVHACERYVEEPLLCEYVWKQEQLQKSSNNNDGNSNESMDEDANVKQEADSSDPPPVEDSMDLTPANTNDDNNNHDSSDNNNSQTNLEMTYEDYVARYCLLYVRTFFNQHLDDSWFRALYSPLESHRETQKEWKRATTEAKDMLASAQKNRSKFRASMSLSHGTTDVPAGHLFTPVRHNTLAVILDVPPHVTDAQLLYAIGEHCSSNHGVLDVFSTQPDLDKNLYRTAWARFESSAAKDKMLDSLNRKADVAKKLLELPVDCTDPYGRYEVDVDGRGGGSPDDKPKVRRVTVWVCRSPPPQPVCVLSAAVSSQHRIAQDQQACLQLARAHDEQKAIPSECRLDALLSHLHSEDTALLLDTAIAYLRRVHLLSFYNGCHKTTAHVASVMNNNAPAGTIHVRLKDADDILKKAAKEDESLYQDLDTDNQNQNHDNDNDNHTAKDMLVMRLDENIETALSQPPPTTQEQIKQQQQDVENIRRAEEECQVAWIEQHAVVDTDGRARCSFHFCRKLFKDKTFLKKHLLKKHPEFLRAEVAKCHDAYMMKSWDHEHCRPVPPILVDCGRQFGLIPVPVHGASRPTIVDPEPNLWKQHRQQQEQKEAAQHQHQLQQQQQHHQQQSSQTAQSQPRSSNDPDHHNNHNNNNHFVDIDDMKDEKVRLSFDGIITNIEKPPKKKRKKKKLL